MNQVKKFEGQRHFIHVVVLVHCISHVDFDVRYDLQTTENGLEGDACDDEGTIPKSDSAYSLDIPNSQILWQADPRPEDSAKVSCLSEYSFSSLSKGLNSRNQNIVFQYYQFTLYAMMLNEMDEQSLCKTDSRLRPDIRKLEEGDIGKSPPLPFPHTLTARLNCLDMFPNLDTAAFEKNRLEEKQREARKLRKKVKNTVKDWKPR